MNRTSFLIDGFNLYHSVVDAGRDLGGASVKWLDIRSLCASYLSLVGRRAEIEKICYFTALAEHMVSRDPGKIDRHKALIDCLKSAGVTCDADRTGLLITPEFGPRVKVTTVITSPELIPDLPIDMGTAEFCAKCGKRAEVCPAQALPHGERTAEPHSICNSAGELKWRVNAVKCAKHWTDGHVGCNVCIACCPYNGMDKVWDCGKPRDEHAFRDDWQPRPYAARGTPAAL